MREMYAVHFTVHGTLLVLGSVSPTSTPTSWILDHHLRARQNGDLISMKETQNDLGGSCFLVAYFKTKLEATTLEEYIQRTIDGFRLGVRMCNT